MADDAEEDTNNVLVFPGNEPPPPNAEIVEHEGRLRYRWFTHDDSKNLNEGWTEHFAPLPPSGKFERNGQLWYRYPEQRGGKWSMRIAPAWGDYD